MKSNSCLRPGAPRIVHASTRRQVSLRASPSTIDKAGENVVHIKAEWSKAYAVRPTSTSITEYMANAQTNLIGYKLPLGAELKPLNPDAGKWEMAVPKMQFFDIFIKCAPRSKGGRGAPSTRSRLFALRLNMHTSLWKHMSLKLDLPDRTHGLVDGEAQTPPAAAPHLHLSDIITECKHAGRPPLCW